MKFTSLYYINMSHFIKYFLIKYILNYWQVLLLLWPRLFCNCLCIFFHRQGSLQNWQAGSLIVMGESY